MPIQNFDVYLIKFVNEHLISYQIKTISIYRCMEYFLFPCLTLKRHDCETNH